MSDDRPAADHRQDDELRAIMATLAHDLRTPLAAVFGEVDLALRRDRTADAYREILTRIRVGLAELLELSADVALVGEVEPGAPGVVPLDEVIAALAVRYPEVSIQARRMGRFVAGDQTRIVRALGLVIEHVRKCDPSGHAVMLEDGAVERGATPATRLLFRTGPSGAVRRGTFRLRAAAQFIRACGGGLEVVDTQPGAAVEIHLPEVLPHVK